MRIVMTSLLLGSVLGTIVQAANPVTADEVKILDQDWGTGGQMQQVRHITIAGQPDAQGLKKAQNEGIQVVLNLRGLDEPGGEHAALIQELGMSYQQIPIMGNGGLNPQAVDQISAAVAAADGKPILLHCASGNRAAAWLAIHLAEQQGHGMAIDEALKVARKAGLTSDALAQLVRDYLQ